MTYTLKNENLTVTINSLGAEVVSVKDRNGRELWWNGDPAFWKGHSPILFPACGGLWNGKYSLNGKEYNMPKHGFAKGMEFEIDKNSPVTDSDEVSEVSFTTTSNDETMACFPFKWQLTLRYTLRGEQLECEAEVSNLSDETMHYQIGGHPALALPDFDTVEGDDASRIIGYMTPTNTAASGPVNGVSVVRAGEQDRAFGNVQNVGACFAHFPDVPAVQSEQVEADDQDFVLSVVGAHAACIEVIQFRNGYVIEIISCEISSDFR